MTLIPEALFDSSTAQAHMAREERERGVPDPSDEESLPERIQARDPLGQRSFELLIEVEGKIGTASSKD